MDNLYNLKFVRKLFTFNPIGEFFHPSWYSDLKNGLLSNLLSLATGSSNLSNFWDVGRFGAQWGILCPKWVQCGDKIQQREIKHFKS